MLLARHGGCLMSTPEGFEDAVGALPEAETAIFADAPCVDPGFADAIRAFCQRVVGE
jgi:hypothetical protein